MTTPDKTTTTMTMTTWATTPVAIVTTAKTPAHLGNGNDTGSASSLAAGGRVVK
jgi:hypothetical protein